MASKTLANLLFLSVWQEKFGEKIDKAIRLQLYVIWMVLVLRIADDLPNFLPAKLSRYTICTAAHFNDLMM